MLLSGLRKCSTLQVMKEEHQERDPVQRRVGCTAGIKKVQRHDNGIWPATLKVLAEGGSLSHAPSCSPSCELPPSSDKVSQAAAA